MKKILVNFNKNKIDYLKINQKKINLHDYFKVFFY